MSDCKRYTEAELQERLAIEIAELKFDYTELLKDKARLDWLADVNNTVGNVGLPRYIVGRNLHSLRAAIDEAVVIDNLRRGK